MPQEFKITKTKDTSFTNSISETEGHNQTELESHNN